MLKMLINILFLFIFAAVLEATANLAQIPAPTRTAKLPTVAERAVTLFYTIVSTPYLQNRYSIGYSKFNKQGDFYAIYPCNCYASIVLTALQTQRYALTGHSPSAAFPGQDAAIYSLRVALAYRH